MLHWLPVPADVGTFTLSERTEVRVRDPDPTTNEAALDLDLSADAHATLASKHALYTLAYTPRLTFVDVNAVGLDPSLLHTGTVSAAWHTGRALVTVRETGSYGTSSLPSFSALQAPGTPVETGPGGQPLAVPNAQLSYTVRTVLIMSSNTSVSSTLNLRPWLVTGIVGYQLSGGATPNSQRSLPLQQGPYAQGIADLRATHRDHLVTLVNGAEATFSPPAGLAPVGSLAGTPGTGTGVLLMQAQEQWRHAWSRTTDTMLAAGASETRTRNSGYAPYTFTTAPTAEASIERRFGRGRNHATVTLDVRLAPVINQLTGVVDDRVQATADAAWTRRKLTLRLAVTAAESTDQSLPTASKLLTGEVDAAYDYTREITADVGARFLAQDQNEPSATPSGLPYIQGAFNQAIVFIGLTWRPIRTHF